MSFRDQVEKFVGEGRESDIRYDEIIAVTELSKNKKNR